MIQKWAYLDGEMPDSSSKGNVASPQPSRSAQMFAIGVGDFSVCGLKVSAGLYGDG